MPTLGRQRDSLRGMSTVRFPFFCRLLLIAALLCAAVAGDGRAAEEQDTRRVFVLSNGWHTAIIVAVTDVAQTGLVPERADFPAARYLEFGWGDREYYPAEEKTIGMTLGAAFISTPAVMHVAGLASAPRSAGGSREMVTLELEDAGFTAMMAAIDETFDRPDGERAATLTQGLYPDSWFYEAHGSFHLLNTCNTWVAGMLSAGGVEISSTDVHMADDLMKQLQAVAAAPS